MFHIHRRRLLQAGSASATLPLLASFQSFAFGAAESPLIDGAPPLPGSGAFTIAVLPDTQNYSQFHPDTFKAQTDWIAEQKTKRKIACVLHLGDITNNNTPNEWKNASDAMKRLDGVVPYFMAPGNHDYSEGGHCTDRTTLMNDYFPVSHFQRDSTFGGVYDKEPNRIENSYHVVSAEGCDLLVLALEFGPRNDVVRWANEVIAQYPNHKAILITHAYMYHDETRYDWETHVDKQKWSPHAYGVAKASHGDVNDGEELWRKLVSSNPQFIMTLNGHVLEDGLAYLSSKNSAGNDVAQMLVNFQMKPNGGDGWLRLLEITPKSGAVQVYDYSPTLDKQNESVQNRFSFHFPV